MPSTHGETYGVLAAVSDKEILERLASGEKAVDIAESIGVHKSAIYHRYTGNPEYLAAREQGMQARVEETETEIGKAADQFSLSRAREKFRAVAWRAEREFPHRWGQKQQIEHSFSDLGDQLRRAKERVVHSAAPQIIDAEIIEDTKG